MLACRFKVVWLSERRFIWGGDEVDPQLKEDTIVDMPTSYVARIFGETSALSQIEHNNVSQSYKHHWSEVEKFINVLIDEVTPLM